MLMKDDMKKKPITDEDAQYPVWVLQQKFETPFHWVYEAYTDTEENTQKKVQLSKTATDYLNNFFGKATYHISMGFKYKRYDTDNWIFIYGSFRQHEGDQAENDLLIKIFPRDWKKLNRKIAEKIDRELSKLFGFNRVFTYFGPVNPFTEPAYNVKIKDGIRDPQGPSKLKRFIEKLVQEY